MRLVAWLRRPLVTRVLLWSFAHFAGLVLLDSLLFLIIHIPTVINLDPIILFLTGLHTVLRAPARWLRMLWPAESTPQLVLWTLALVNTFLWGLVLSGLQTVWRKVRY